MLAPAAVALLSLLAGEPRLALDLRLGPPLALAAQHEPAPPDLAPPRVPAAPPRPSLAGATARASLGIALADLASAGLMISGFANACLFESCSGEAGGALFLAGAASWLFVSPAIGVRLARTDGQGSFGRAYWLAFLVRVGALATLAAGDAAPVLFVATELFLAPYVIARTLQGAPAAAPEPAVALARARPEADPSASRAR